MSYTNMAELRSMTDGRISGGNGTVATHDCSDGIVMDLGKMCGLRHGKCTVEFKTTD